MEKYVEDVKQEEKHVPDLLEAIMRPTCLVKKELRQILSKLNQFRSEITKNPGLTRKSKVPKWICRWTLASFRSGPPFFAIFGPARGQIYVPVATGPPPPPHRPYTPHPPTVGWGVG